MYANKFTKQRQWNDIFFGNEREPLQIGGYTVQDGNAVLCVSVGGYSDTECKAGI